MEAEIRVSKIELREINLKKVYFMLFLICYLLLSDENLDEVWGIKRLFKVYSPFQGMYMTPKGIVKLFFENNL